MKWLFLLVPLFFIPFAFCFDGLFGGRLLFSDSVNAQLNRRLKNELKKRIPSDRPVVFLGPLDMATGHRLTISIPCIIRLPKTKIQDPQEALDIYLGFARAYVDAMNNVPEARPYFFEFPFTMDLWDLVIEFAREPKTGMYYPDPFLSEVTCDGGTFSIARLEKGRRIVYTNVYEHPKVLPEELQKMVVPHFDEKKEPKKIPESSKFCSFNTGLEPDFDFFRKFAKQNNLILIALDFVFTPRTYQSFKNCCMAEAFAAQEKYLTLEECKELVAKTREANIQFSSTIERVGNWANSFRERGEEALVPRINLQEYMGFRISFWDQYIDRVKPPHIAEICVTGTKAKYYVSDELQRLQLVHEEDLPSYDVEIPVPEELLKNPPKIK